MQVVQISYDRGATKLTAPIICNVLYYRTPNPFDFGKKKFFTKNVQILHSFFRLSYTNEQRTLTLHLLISALTSNG